jgi:hypothetical protein
MGIDLSDLCHTLYLSEICFARNAVLPDGHVISWKRLLPLYRRLSLNMNWPSLMLLTMKDKL